MNTDIYGFADVDMGNLAQALEKLLGISWKLHESDFLGGQYFRAQTNIAEYILHKNLDTIEQTPIYPEYSSYMILLIANSNTNSHEIKDRILSGIRASAHLKRDSY